MLKHEIFLCMMGSTVLHALMLFFLTHTVTVSQLPMIAMETFIIESPSVSAKGSPQPLQHVASVLSEHRTLKKDDSPSDQKRYVLKSAPGHDIHPDNSRKNKIPALGQGPAASKPAKTNSLITAAAENSSPASFRLESGGSIATAISPVGTEAPRELSLGDAGAPRFIHRELPIYPFIARKLGKEGKVVLRLTLDEKGGQKDIEIIEKGGYGFTEAAVLAIKKSILSPALKDGKSVVSKVLIPVKFVLRED